MFGQVDRLIRIPQMLGYEQLWGIYQYAGNKPLTYTDPTGLSCGKFIVRAVTIPYARIQQMLGGASFDMNPFNLLGYRQGSSIPSFEVEFVPQSPQGDPGIICTPCYCNLTTHQYELVQAVQIGDDEDSAHIDTTTAIMQACTAPS
jgi:hypothetical protein